MISIVTASEKEKAQALNQKGNFLRGGGYKVRDNLEIIFLKLSGKVRHRG